MRARPPRPNRIGANPVAVKTSELTPRRGRLHNQGAAWNSPHVRPPYYNPGGQFSEYGKFSQRLLAESPGEG